MFLCQTHHLRKTLNPEWNFSYKYIVPYHCKVWYITLHVLDKDGITFDDMLGSRRVQLENENGM